MERYSEYKDSGVKWLGDIPKHWEICRFKNIMSLITTPSTNATNSRKIGLENIESSTGKFIDCSNDYEGNGIMFLPDDILYGKLRPYLQKVWTASFSGNAVGDFFVFRTNSKVSSKYINYIMLSHGFTEVVNSSTFGAKMPRVSADYIQTLRSCVPPLEEQDAIVAYLDKVTAKIDAAIEQQQKMIALLNERKQIIINNAVTKGLDPTAKMKPSGIDWLGSIPAHWEVRRLKSLMSMQRGHDLTAEKFKVGNVPVYGSGGLMGYHNQATSNSPNIVIGRSGSVGRLHYIEEDFWAHNTVIYLTDSKGNDVKYIYYLLSSLDLSSLATQTAVPTLDRKNVLNKTVATTMNISEQMRIAEHLDKLVESINVVITNKNEEISLLQERKQIIINDIVTGKVKVS